MEKREGKVIELNELERTFKVLRRKEGFKGAIKDLFSRDYEYVKAVDKISLNIQDGEIVGYVGPNGAGKSTTIKMMTGILQPSGGTVLINGRNPYENKNEHMRKIGVVFGQRSQLWWSLPVIESFTLLRDIYKVDKKTYQNNMELFESLVNIKDLYHKPVRQMSLGQRMLCEVVASFIHDPEVVFLDEPTIGLDITVKDSIRQLIKQLNEEKKTTIVLTSHDTKDIEALCERVVIIDHGKKIFDDRLAQLKQVFGKYRTITLHMPTGTMPYEEMKQLVEANFKGDSVRVVLKETEDVAQKNNCVSFIVSENDISFNQVLQFVTAQFLYDEITIEDVGVEEVIKKIYERGVE